MEPEPDMPAAVDLNPLAPRHTDAVYARIAARAKELHELRRAVVRRGAIAAVLAVAAAFVFWLSAPHRDVAPTHAPTMQRSHDILELGMRSDVDPYELLDLGGSHAQ